MADKKECKSCHKIRSSRNVRSGLCRACRNVDLGGMVKTKGRMKAQRRAALMQAREMLGFRNTDPKIIHMAVCDVLGKEPDLVNLDQDLIEFTGIEINGMKPTYKIRNTTGLPKFKRF